MRWLSGYDLFSADLIPGLGMKTLSARIVAKNVWAKYQASYLGVASLGTSNVDGSGDHGVQARVI